MKNISTLKKEITHITRKIFPVSLFLLLLPLMNVWANISKSLGDSLLFTSSGNFLWSMWDYQTNPYLYSYNKKNSLSFQVTGNTLFSLGSTFLIVGQPIYFGVQLSNKGSLEFDYNELPSNFGSNTKNSKLDTSNLKIILGTLPFVNLGFLEKMGIGVYYRRKRNTVEEFPKNLGTGVTQGTRTGEAIVSSNRGALSLNSIGIELGQTGEDENSNVTGGEFSYSVAFGYNDYGVDIEGLDGSASQGKNDAPFLELGTSVNGFVDLFKSHLYFGPKKKEYTVNFLSWVVTTPGVNVGVAYNANYQPTLIGVDNSLQTRTSEYPAGLVSKVGIDSLRHTAELFVDLDSNIYSEETSIGVFRVTPSLIYSYHSEEAEFDEVLAGGTIINEESFWRFKLAFKFYVYFDKAKTFRLVAGWSPHFILSHEFTQAIENFNIVTLQNTESKTYKYRRQKRFFEDDGSILASGRLGMEYAPVKDLALHLGMASSNDGFFNLSELSFGIDYAF